MGRTLREVLSFLRGLYQKADRDQIWFLSAGVSFNVLVTIVPLAMLAISALGFFLASSDEAYDRTITVIQRLVPLSDEEARNLLESLVPARGLTGLLGAVGLVWTATRLFGSLRTVLYTVFEVERKDRMGPLHGKVHDVRMVVVIGVFFLFSMALTAGIRWVQQYGIPFLGFPPDDFADLFYFVTLLVTFLLTLAMFFLLYYFGPNRQIEWETCLVAALVSGAFFEIAKQGFVAYLSEFDRFTALYGQFGALVALLVWVYFSTVAFILGGEIAWLLERRRRERIHPGP